MAADFESIDEYLKHVMDKYTPAELVDALDVEIWEVVDAFYDLIIRHRKELLDD